MSFKQQLYQHYIAAPKKVFQQFKLGAMVFFLGLVVIYTAHSLLSESLAQEIATLIGLIFVGLGFIIAMMAQIRSLIGRLLRFFKSD